MVKKNRFDLSNILFFILFFFSLVFYLLWYFWGQGQGDKNYILTRFSYLIENLVRGLEKLEKWGKIFRKKIYTRLICSLRMARVRDGISASFMADLIFREGLFLHHLEMRWK